MAASILHVIQRLTTGGAARSMVAEARCTARDGRYRHRIASLLPADPEVVARLEANRLGILDAPDRGLLLREMACADLVQVHFWNTPELYELLRAELPPTRLILRPHVGGLYPPHVLTRALIGWADLVLISSPLADRLPGVAELPPEVRRSKVSVVYDVADFERLEAIAPHPHSTFNVGYIGTLRPVKMHPDYLAMSARLDIPDVRLVLCGSPADFQPLHRRAERLGIADRLDFRGYVEDIGMVLAQLDVFGYPLCEGNYSAGELVLQEAMYAGVPPVVFSHGGAGAMVEHDRTGIVVRSADEYVRAIERLYRRPDERRRLGLAARAHAVSQFGTRNAGPRLRRQYACVLAGPKRRRTLADAPSGATGSELFVAALDGAAPEFEVSLHSRDPADLLAAEAQIARAAPVLCNETGGGIFHYRNFYKDDGLLRLWSALALMGQGQNVRALAELREALALGYDHWRVSWYLAQTAARLGARAVVVAALQTVLAAAPDFGEARRMLGQWDR